MTTTRLSSKGQVIIPKAVRESQHWKPGTVFDVEQTEEGILLRPSQLFNSTSLDSVAGCLPYKGKAKTLKDMEAAIAKGVKKAST